jgi:hypothetical protein
MRFRIRSSQRDATADANRLAPIEQSIQKAIADAEAEKKGLKQRIEKQRGQASMSMGNEVYGDLEREPDAEKSLSKAEKDLSQGLARVRELNAHLEHLHRVLAVLLKTINFA